MVGSSSESSFYDNDDDSSADESETDNRPLSSLIVTQQVPRKAPRKARTPTNRRRLPVNGGKTSAQQKARPPTTSRRPPVDGGKTSASQQMAAPRYDKPDELYAEFIEPYTPSPPEDARKPRSRGSTTSSKRARRRTPPEGVEQPDEEPDGTGGFEDLSALFAAAVDEAAPAPTKPPTEGPPTTSLPSRRMTHAETASTVRRGIIKLKMHNQRVNTRRCYLPKWQQYLDFCKHVYKDEHDVWIKAINAERVVNFMFYQCMRSNAVQLNKRKKKGDPTKQKGHASSKFDYADYCKVMQSYKTWLDQYRDSGHAAGSAGDRAANEYHMPHTDYPLGPDTLNHYRCAIRFQYDIHRRQGQNNLRWDEIWDSQIDDMIRLAVQRIPKEKKRRYEEKVNFQSDPYMLVDRFNEIERKLWEKGEVNMRSAFAWLRHRYVFLHSTHGILRCETIFNGELSDCLMLRAEGTPHFMWILIQQIAQGKTVKPGQKIFGRVMRHKDVSVCGFGALAMYLALRIHLTQEFANWKVTDWFDNERWFDIKLLVDVHGSSDFNKPMTNVSYGKAVKTVLKELAVPSSKFVHIGRKLGALDLELLGIPGEDIDNLGNWNRTIRLQSYSGNVPMNPIMAKARFRGRLLHSPDAAPSHCNVRQSVEVPDELLNLSPLEFGRRYFEPLKEMCLDLGDKQMPKTALSFLNLVQFLNVALIQDLAALSILDPSRVAHPIFGSMEFMKHEKWRVFVDTMGAAIVSDKERTSMSGRNRIDDVLPGVNSQFDGLHTETAKISIKLDAVDRKIDQSNTSVCNLTDMLKAGCHGFLGWTPTPTPTTTPPESGWNTPHGNSKASSTNSNRITTSHGRRLNANPLDDDATASTVTNTTVTTTRSRYDLTSNDPPPADMIPRPKTRYETLSELWEWWHGDVILLEKRYPNATWRICPGRYKPSEQKNFSRVKRVVEGVLAFAARGQCPVEYAISVLEDTYAQQAKKKLDNMVLWMKQQRLLDQRPRKREDQDPNPDPAAPTQ
jgi:hypothetical protein